MLGYVAAGLFHTATMLLEELHKPDEAVRTYNQIIARTRDTEHPFLKKAFIDATAAKAAIIGIKNPYAAFQMSRQLRQNSGTITDIKEQRESSRQARLSMAIYGLLSGKRFLLYGLRDRAKRTLRDAAEAIDSLKPFDVSGQGLIAAYIHFLLNDTASAKRALMTAPRRSRIGAD